MIQQKSKPAILSKTLQFLAAGGITIIGAVIQEVLKPQPDWGMVATMVAGAVLGIGGGVYGRVVAQGPVTSVLKPVDGK